MKQGPNPFERKCCYDCGWLEAYVNWWCGSKEAKKARGTAIPGVQHCPFWKPDWSYINRFWKIYNKAQLHQIVD